jgi:hypothetical protein
VKEKATARPRFKLRTWGTLRVVLSVRELPRSIEGSLKDSGFFFLATRLADCKEESNVREVRLGVVSQLCIAARKRFGKYPGGSHGSEVVGVATPDIMSMGKSKHHRH